MQNTAHYKIRTQICCKKNEKEPVVPVQHVCHKQARQKHADGKEQEGIANSTLAWKVVKKFFGTHQYFPANPRKAFYQPERIKFHL